MAAFGKKKNQVKDEFVFDEDGDLPFEDETEEFAPSLMKGGRGGGGGGGGGSSSAIRTVMLLLILVAIGGGAYYYLVMVPSSSAPTKPAPSRKTVTVTPKPTTAPQSVPVPVQQAPGQPSTKTVDVPPVASTPQPVSATKSVPAPTTTVKPVPPTPPPVSVKPATTQAVVTPATSVVREAEPVVEPESAPPLVAQVGGYTLLGGSFVTREGLLDAERKARRLGHTAQVKEIRRPVTMIRLRIGYFSPAEAEAQRKSLSRKIPGIFTLKKGDQVALYAASHYSLDKARSYADQLFQQGIRVEEEAVEVMMPLKQLHYGVFVSQAAAEKAGKQARKLGLEAVVVKR